MIYECNMSVRFNVKGNLIHPPPFRKTLFHEVETCTYLDSNVDTHSEIDSEKGIHITKGAFKAPENVWKSK